jgi:hypothetical protein
LLCIPKIVKGGGNRIIFCNRSWKRRPPKSFNSPNLLCGLALSQQLLGVGVATSLHFNLGKGLLLGAFKASSGTPLMQERSARNQLRQSIACGSSKRRYMNGDGCLC